MKSPRGPLADPPKFGARALRRLAALLLSACALLFLTQCVDADPEMTHESLVIDWRDEIIYQIVVDRFEDGDPSNNDNVDLRKAAAYHGGDWQGIIDRLDYIEALGVTALWISPVVRNVEEDAGFASYHGYWTQDFLKVNPHFGDLSKLQELVRACHKRGLKVILDVVTNHVGQLFYYDINRNGQPDIVFFGGGGPGTGSQVGDHPSDLRRVSEWDPDYDRRGVQGFTALGENGPAPIVWVEMPEINRTPPNPPQFRNPEWYNRRGRVTVWEQPVGIAKSCGQNSDCDGNPRCTTAGECDFECDLGSHSCRPSFAYTREQEIKGDFPGGLKDLDTSRADVTEALIEVFQYWIKVADFDGFRIDTLKHQEHSFFERFAPAMRRYAKQLGKKNFFMFGEAFDGNDELLGSYTQGEGVDSVFYFSYKYRVFDNIFGRGAAPIDAQRMFEERSAPTADGTPRYADTPKQDGPTDADGQGLTAQQLLVNFIDNHDVPRFLFNFPQVTRLRLALSHLLTMDGIPCIYYGTEQNFYGGPDPENREDMWTSEFAQNGETFRLVQRLIKLRKQHAALRRGDLRFVWASPHAEGTPDAGLLAFERSYRDERVLVMHNVNGETTAESQSEGEAMAVSFAPGTTLEDELSGERFTVSAEGRLLARLAPLQTRILVAR